MINSRNQFLLLCALVFAVFLSPARLSLVAQDAPDATVPLPVITKASKIRSLPPEEAGRGYPVRIRGVVTLIDADAKIVFVQDSTGGISVAAGPGSESLARGLDVEVEGVTAPGHLSPIVQGAKWKSFGPGKMPRPNSPSLKQIISGRPESEWMQLQGVVRVLTEQPNRVSFDLVRDWRHLSCELLVPPVRSPLKVDQLVTIHAVCEALVDTAGKFSGIKLIVPSGEDIIVNEEAPTDPFDVTTLPTRELPTFSVPKLFQHRVKIQGTVTCQLLGRSFYVQEETGGAYVHTRQSDALRPGDRVEVVGFPELLEFSPVLRDSTYRKIGSGAPPVAMPMPVELPLHRDYNYKLVEVEGWFIDSYSQADVRVLVLQSGSQVFEARLDESAAGKNFPKLVKGARLKLTGPLFIKNDPRVHPTTFRIMLRSPEDIAVLQLPSWWTFDHTWKLGAIVALLLLAAIAWVLALRRRVRQQTNLIRRQLGRELSLAELGYKLARAESAQAAARIVVNVAQELLGWDACHLDLYSPDQNKIFPILTMDTVEGEKIEIPCEPAPISNMAREVLEKGAKLVLRKCDPRTDVNLNAYGKGRKSASLMFVPLRDGTRAIGVLSIQSYTSDFYDEKKLSILQALADHCGGALERIRTRDELQDAHDELERRVTERTAELTLANEQLQQEIVERKRVQEELSRNQHLFDSLLHNVPDFIYFKDAQSRFTRVNEAFLSQIGLSVDQVIGKTDFDLLDRELAQQAFEDEQHVMRTGQPLLTKEEHVHGLKGGEWWVTTTKMPLRDEFGKIIGTFGISRNITARKHAELALAKKEEEYRVIFDSVPAMIIYKDTQNRHLRSNKFTAEISGFSQEQIDGRLVTELNPTHGDKYYQDDLEVIRSGQPKLGIVEPMICANGETRWLQTDKIPYRDTSGNVIGVIVFSVDVTKRKAAEDALKSAYDELEHRVDERTAKLSKAIALLKQEINERREAEVRNEAFSNLGQRLSQTTTPEAAAKVAFDVADKLLGWDAAYLHLFTSTEPRKVIPVVMFDTINGERIAVRDNPRGDELSARDRRLIEQGAELIRGAAATDRNLSRFGDTTRPSLSLMFVPIRNGGKVMGVMSVQSYTADAYDEDDLDLLQALADFCAGTLERIQAEQSLRDSEERFAKAFRSSPVPMTLSTLKHGFYIDVNDSMLQLIGYSREEMLGRTALELGVWADPHLRAKMLEQLQAKKSVRDFECQLRTRAGALRDVLLSVERLDSGGTAYILVNIHDVTERLNLEMQLRHSQKLEAIGQLAAGVAHDFNNILTIIQGHVGLLSAEQPVPAHAEDSLTQIAAASDRAAALTQQLLAFSRKQIMQPKQLHLSDVITNTAQVLRRVLGENIQLQLSNAPELPAVYADVGMIEQVILNLAVNARDAMSHGGTLTISTSIAQVDAQWVRKNRESRQGTFVCLTISDTGCGMNPETLSHLFEPFFTTKEVGKGTGLGLATVYGIVKQHQGWIQVSSELGKGTTFKVFLPSSSPEVAPPPPVVLDENVTGGHETILVVEDELALRQLVCSVLQHFGYRVIPAAHGREALKIWEEKIGNIDLLLTDMMMPEGLSGWDLAEEIHKRQPNLKVIYTSGYSVDLFGQNRALREGVNFLAKPYHPNTLAKAVRACLDN